MKLYIQNPTALLFLICSVVSLISCSKDSDLFNEYVLSDPETDPIENSDGVGPDGEGGSGTSNKAGDNVLINSTFDTQDNWVLLNGSTINNGVLSMVGNDISSAEFRNLLNSQYYQTRRFRITFSARQTAGSNPFVVAQKFSRVFEQVLTSEFETYTTEFDGNFGESDNYIWFKGSGENDQFEIDNFTMEIIGDTSNPNVPGKPAQITFFTDFEFSTYGYDQWGTSGVPEDELNQWEIDHGTPRDTRHSDSPLTSGRDGTGEAVWLGNYNNNDTRNEMVKDVALPFGEFWYGFSFYVQNRMNDNRIMMQARNLAPGGSSTVNAIALRQAEDSDKIYFSVATNVNFVDQTRDNLGYWNGAGTNTQQVFADYNYRGWNDVVIHFKGGFGANYTGPDTSSLLDDFGYDPRSDGFIEIWVNGEKIIDHVGTTLYRYEKRGGEIRNGLSPTIGTYWGGPANLPTGGDVYYDNYAIWVGPNGTYENVDPGR
ncbi:heparin lyase I family protein [Flagellimonas sp. 2504JD1-5]